MVFNRRIAAALHLAFEHETGFLRGVADHLRTVHTLTGHGGQQIAAHRIRAQAAGPGNFQPEPCQADGDIGFGAGAAFVKRAGCFQRAGAVCHQQQHGFAESNDIKHVGQGAALLEDGETGDNCTSASCSWDLKNCNFCSRRICLSAYSALSA